MIEAFKTPSLTISCEEEISWTLDGEFGGEHSQVEIKNLKHGAQIMLPVNEEVPLIHNVPETEEEMSNPRLTSGENDTEGK